MNRLMCAVLFIILVITPTVVSGEEEEIFCGMIDYPPPPQRWSIPEGDTLMTKIIYVGFYNRLEHAALDLNKTSIIPEEMEQFIAYHSNGKVFMDIEPIINPANPDTAWMAAHDDTMYAKPENVEQIARYSHCYGTGSFAHAGELQAEILDTIWQTLENYYGPGQFENPFENVDVVFYSNAGKCLWHWYYGYYGGFGHLQVSLLS